jgi:hypothetical protein
MNRCGDRSATLQLRGAINPRRIEIAVGFGRNLSSFRDDETCARALFVTQHHERGRYLLRSGTIAGPGRHHDAIAGAEAPEANGIE